MYIYINKAKASLQAFTESGQFFIFILLLGKKNRNKNGIRM